MSISSSLNQKFILYSDKCLHFSGKNKPQHSEEIKFGDVLLKLVFNANTSRYCNGNFTLLHLNARKIPGSSAADSIMIVRCKVDIVDLGDKIPIKDDVVTIELTQQKSNKRVKQWQFIPRDEFKLIGLNNNGKVKIIWEIFEIGCQRTFQVDPDLRLSKKFITNKITWYDLHEFDDFVHFQNRVTDEMVNNFRMLLKHIYEGRNGLMKMFVDNLEIVNEKGKAKVKHSCDYKSGQIQGEFSINLSSKIDLNVQQFQSAHDYEKQLIDDLDLKEEKTKRQHYVYLLLDPSVTQNLPSRAFPIMQSLLRQHANNHKPFNLLNLIQPELFQDFIRAIFYVGLGQKGRSLEHIANAKRYQAHNANLHNNKQINQIWKNSNRKKGPILLHYIEKINIYEARNLEGYFIQTVGLHNLNNLKAGEKDTRLSERKRKDLGMYLLCKAFVKLLLEGEDQQYKDTEEILDKDTLWRTNSTKRSYAKSSDEEDEEEEEDEEDEEDEEEEEGEEDEKDEEDEEGEEDEEDSEDKNELSDRDINNSLKKSLFGKLSHRNMKNYLDKSYSENDRDGISYSSSSNESDCDSVKNEESESDSVKSEYSANDSLKSEFSGSDSVKSEYSESDSRKSDYSERDSENSEHSDNDSVKSEYLGSDRHPNSEFSGSDSVERNYFYTGYSRFHSRNKRRRYN